MDVVRLEGGAARRPPAVRHPVAVETLMQCGLGSSAGSRTHTPLAAVNQTQTHFIQKEQHVYFFLVLNMSSPNFDQIILIFVLGNSVLTKSIKRVLLAMHAQSKTKMSLEAQHTHTHTHTQRETHTRTQTHADTCAHTHTRARAHTHTHTHAHTHAHTRTHTHTERHTHRERHTHTHTLHFNTVQLDYTHTHTHTRMNTHTHTHTRAHTSVVSIWSLSCSRCEAPTPLGSIKSPVFYPELTSDARSLFLQNRTISACHAEQSQSAQWLVFHARRMELLCKWGKFKVTSSECSLQKCALE